MNIDEFEGCLLNNEELLRNILEVDDSETSYKKLTAFEHHLQMHFKKIGQGVLNSPNLNAIDIKNLQSSTEVGLKIFGNSYDYVDINNRKSSSASKEKMRFSNLYRSADMPGTIYGDNSLDYNQNTSVEDPSILGSHSKMEAKLQRFQQELGKKINSESLLEDQVKKLKKEIEGLNKLLSNKQYYTDLKESISNISEVILNTNKNIKLKEENQVILQKLISESTIDRIKDLEKQNQALCDNLQGLKLKIREEIKRSHESYGLARKYISTIKTCNKMQKDLVDITFYIENANMDTQEDLEKIEDFQLKSTQNNILVRSFTPEHLESINNDNPTNLLENALIDKDKKISRLEHELKIVNKSKRRTASQMRKFRSGAKKVGDELSKDNSDVESAISTKHLSKIPDLLQNSDYKRSPFKAKRKLSSPKYISNALHQEFDEEPTPKPTPFENKNTMNFPSPHPELMSMHK